MCSSIERALADICVSNESYGKKILLIFKFYGRIDQYVLWIIYPNQKLILRSKHYVEIQSNSSCLIEAVKTMIFGCYAALSAPPVHALG